MNSEIEIIDNFLEEVVFNKLKKFILSDGFPWYLQNGKVSPNDGFFQMTHVFLHFGDKKINSPFFSAIEPIYQKLKADVLYQSKINMTFKQNEIVNFPMHTDGQFEGFTSVYYINTNNGKTVFESGEEVNSVENRMVVFPSKLIHSGTTHTDELSRVVLNSNFKR